MTPTKLLIGQILIVFAIVTAPEVLDVPLAQRETILHQHHEADISGDVLQ
jgi:hypothetical protein